MSKAIFKNGDEVKIKDNHFIIDKILCEGVGINGDIIQYDAINRNDTDTWTLNEEDLELITPLPQTEALETLKNIYTFEQFNKMFGENTTHNLNMEVTVANIQVLSKETLKLIEKDLKELQAIKNADLSEAEKALILAQNEYNENHENGLSINYGLEIVKKALKKSKLLENTLKKHLKMTEKEFSLTKFIEEIQALLGGKENE